jgi:hypothetical protein
MKRACSPRLFRRMTNATSFARVAHPDVARLAIIAAKA